MSRQAKIANFERQNSRFIENKLENRVMEHEIDFYVSKKVTYFFTLGNNANCFDWKLIIISFYYNF